MTAPKKTTSSTSNRVWTATSVIAYLLFMGLVVIAAATSLAGCASAPQTQWTGLAVSGTGFVQVFQDGRPRTPGEFHTVATSPGKADFYRGDRFLGTGTVQIVEPRNGSVKLEVAPGARVVITPGN